MTRRIIQKIWNVFRKGDLVLLVLCLATSAFGMLCIASATDHRGFTHYLLIQGLAISLGVVCYVAVSAIDLDFVSEHRGILVLFNLFLRFWKVKKNCQTQIGSCFMSLFS